MDEDALVLTVRRADSAADAEGWTRLGIGASRQMQAQLGPDVVITDPTYQLADSRYLLD